MKNFDTHSAMPAIDCKNLKRKSRAGKTLQIIHCSGS